MNNDTTTTVRIFLIDDHPAVRQGLKLLLSQEGYAVCGGAGSSGEAHRQDSLTTAHLVLLDLSLGEENGLDLIEQFRSEGRGVLVYSMHEDAGTVQKAFSAGANGYVTKREASDILLTAVAEVVAGRRYVSPQAAQSLASKALSRDSAPPLFSQREQQILDLLGQGEPTPDIAGALAISNRTVETYYTRLIDKLQLSGMKALRRYAIQNR